MLLTFNMLDFYVPIRLETMEVVRLDCDVLGARSYLWRNRKCDRPLIILISYDYTFKKTAQQFWRISLKIKYELDFLNMTH